MKKSFDVVIVGGGVTGCSIAYQLAKLGREVLILEKDRLACQASSAAAGMLAAQAELEQNGPLFQLALKSQAMFSSLSSELFECTGIDIEYVQKGMLKIAETEEMAIDIKKQVDFQRNWDPAIQWLESTELREMEPALSPGVTGAMYLPHDGHIQPKKLTKAFAKGAIHFGAEIRENTDVHSFIYDHSNVIGMKTSCGEIYCDQVVIATGAWAATLMQTTGVDIPVYPVKGECFSVKTDKPILLTTLFSDKRCYFVPKRNGEIYIGATMVEHTFDKTVTSSGIAELLERAIHLVPQIKDLALERVWAGIRPRTGDGNPYIGEHPEWKGLFLAAGHFRNGILLSPVTGRLVADMLDGISFDDTPFSAFRLDRSIEMIHLEVKDESPAKWPNS